MEDDGRQVGTRKPRSDFRRPRSSARPAVHKQSHVLDSASPQRLDEVSHYGPKKHNDSRQFKGPVPGGLQKKDHHIRRDSRESFEKNYERHKHKEDRFGLGSDSSRRRTGDESRMREGQDRAHGRNQGAGVHEKNVWREGAKRRDAWNGEEEENVEHQRRPQKKYGMHNVKGEHLGFRDSEDVPPKPTVKVKLKLGGVTRSLGAVQPIASPSLNRPKAYNPPPSDDDEDLDNEVVLVEERSRAVEPAERRRRQNRNEDEDGDSDEPPPLSRSKLQQYERESSMGEGNGLRRGGRERKRKMHDDFETDQIEDEGKSVGIEGGRNEFQKGRNRGRARGRGRRDAGGPGHGRYDDDDDEFELGEEKEEEDEEEDEEDGWDEESVPVRRESSGRGRTRGRCLGRESGRGRGRGRGRVARGHERSIDGESGDYETDMDEGLEDEPEEEEESRWDNADLVKKRKRGQSESFKEPKGVATPSGGRTPLTARQLSMRGEQGDSSAAALPAVEFPEGLPQKQTGKMKEESEAERQLKREEAARKRKLQVEKAAKEVQASAIQKILGQESTRKKKEEKVRKKRLEMKNEKRAAESEPGTSRIRVTLRCNKSVVSFSEDIGLPKFFSSGPASQPKPREKCVGKGCTNDYKYRDSKTALPLCSLKCYKQVEQMYHHLRDPSLDASLSRSKKPQADEGRQAMNPSSLQMPQDGGLGGAGDASRKPSFLVEIPGAWFPL